MYAPALYRAGRWAYGCTSSLVLSSPKGAYSSVSMVERLAEHVPDAATYHSGMDPHEREESALCFAEG
jgi:hypothetical protein